MDFSPLADFSPTKLEVLTRALTAIYQAPGEMMRRGAYEASFAEAPDMLKWASKAQFVSISDDGRTCCLLPKGREAVEGQNMGIARDGVFTRELLIKRLAAAYEGVLERQEIYRIFSGSAPAKIDLGIRALESQQRLSFDAEGGYLLLEEEQKKSARSGGINR